MKVPTRVNRYPRPLSKADTPTNPGGLTADELEYLNALVASRPLQAGVYFIKAGNAIKIGYSENIADRIPCLQTGNPEPLQLIGYLKLGREFEKIIHQQFEHLHLRYEWFRDDPEIRLYLLEHEARA